jgi:hypothetical protein
MVRIQISNTNDHPVLLDGKDISEIVRWVGLDWDAGRLPVVRLNITPTAEGLIFDGDVPVEFHIGIKTYKLIEM